MEALFESIRIEEYGNAVIVYNSELHAKRLLKSIKELGFKKDIPDNEWLLFFQNQIKNFIQYKFNKVMSFKENVIADPNKEAPTHRLYKLRLIYSENAEININIEEYTRDLNKDWKVRVINPEEFAINSQDLQWRHKLYSRENIPVNAEWQEQIWLNEKGEVCEGSFTNIFWQAEDGAWYTPSVSCNILAGVMRKLVINALKAKEVNYTLYDLQKAKTVILTNAMIGIKEINLDH